MERANARRRVRLVELFGLVEIYGDGGLSACLEAVRATFQSAIVSRIWFKLDPPKSTKSLLQADDIADVLERCRTSPQQCAQVSLVCNGPECATGCD